MMLQTVLGTLLSMLRRPHVLLEICAACVVLCSVHDLAETFVVGDVRLCG